MLKDYWQRCRANQPNGQVGDEAHKLFNDRDVDENGVRINTIAKQQLAVERVNRISDSLMQVQFFLHELTYSTRGGNSNSVFGGYQAKVINQLLYPSNAAKNWTVMLNTLPTGIDTNATQRYGGCKATRSVGAAG